MSEGISPAGSHPRHDGESPSPWIVRFAPLLAPGGRVLDLACGRGRHARFLAARGAQVVALDRDSSALASLAGVSNVVARHADVESGGWPLAGEIFDGIVVTNYLHRPLWSDLLASLADDGVLLYETFAVGNEAFGRPSNPAFLLNPGELLTLCDGRLVPVAFEQGHVRTGGRDAVVQRVAAVGRARGWPPQLP